MGISSSIVELLKRERIPYTWFQHKPTYTAQEEAAVSHIRGRCWAKVVVCMIDELPAQAVVPAHYSVDLEELRVLAGATTLRLAREDELAHLYPDSEVGAMPPFGAVYGHRVFVERCLVGEPEMVFNAGTHTDAIRMHYGDFAELAKPTVGMFCRCPNGRSSSAPAEPRQRRRMDPMD
jgi:Ala-tRNA(Pro) deacylase